MDKIPSTFHSLARSLREKVQHRRARSTPVRVWSTRLSTSPSPDGGFDQTQSRFFERLPLEIRLLIYHQVFCALDLSGDVHILRSLGRAIAQLMHFKCLSKPGCEADLKSGASHWGAAHAQCYDEVMDFVRNTPLRYSKTDCLPWLRTCRRLYSEASEILYEAISFHLMTLDTMQRFLTIVSPPQLDHIRVLYLSCVFTSPMYDRVFPSDEDSRDPFLQDVHRKVAAAQEIHWEQTCEIVCKMKALLKLRITIYDTRMFVIPETQLFRPLMNADIDNFVVQLPWTLSIAKDVVQAPLPFEIQRPLDSDVEVDQNADEPGVDVDDGE